MLAVLGPNKEMLGYPFQQKLRSSSYLPVWFIDIFHPKLLANEGFVVDVREIHSAVSYTEYIALEKDEIYHLN